MKVEHFFSEFEQAANTTDFSQVEPFIDEDAIYWFSDGSFIGKSEIRSAFEQTWQTIKNEIYQMKDIEWLGITEEIAVCVYHFHSNGEVDGHPFSAKGRGTNVFRQTNGEWKIIHEHLSRLPD
ncbi:nuclear transport factor 2 family protein [Halobacillus salinarum]|uniref:Nuclear transport factor 2 family protein n=1 Tax=Halobacillus salinarum TaxID=2932257 RepID=A0ABY4ELA6_9BACI|nr:nuclear transport factor 2 family protein [Halobacillus salinarum]UOQ44944.1 nuclear transport factor 2 family protein [Halobacillus salinarum]